MAGQRLLHSPLSPTWKLDIPCWILDILFRPKPVLSKCHASIGRLRVDDEVFKNWESLLQNLTFMRSGRLPVAFATQTGSPTLQKSKEYGY